MLNRTSDKYSLEEFISWSEACANWLHNLTWKFGMTQIRVRDPEDDFASVLAWLFTHLAVAEDAILQFSSRLCAIDDRPATEMYRIALYAKNLPNTKADDIKWMAYSNASAHAAMIRFLQDIHRFVFREIPVVELRGGGHSKTVLSWSAEERAKEKAHKEAEINDNINEYSQRLGKYIIHYLNVVDLVNACYRERCKLLYRLDPTSFLKDGGKLNSRGGVPYERQGPVFVTSTQIVDALGTTRLTREHKKDWPEAVIKAVGGKPDTWNLEELRPYLAKTFGYHKVIDWNTWEPDPEE